MNFNMSSFQLSSLQKKSSLNIRESVTFYSQALIDNMTVIQSVLPVIYCKVSIARQNTAVW